MIENYENEILSVLGAYRSNREFIQNNQDCQTLPFFRHQILQTLAFPKILLLKKSQFQKSEIK
jgi:hypothetical protein